MRTEFGGVVNFFTARFTEHSPPPDNTGTSMLPAQQLKEACVAFIPLSVIFGDLPSTDI
jgi:hypothetical protein